MSTTVPTAPAAMNEYVVSPSPDDHSGIAWAIKLGMRHLALPGQ